MKNFTQVFICTHFLALLSSVFIVFISSTRLYSEEIVLQNGSEYNGCEDACISDDDGQNGQNTNFGDKIFLSLQDDY